MKFINHKRIVKVTILLLSLIVFDGFFIPNLSAQTLSTVDGGNPDIVVTAHVLGCGDGILQTQLGEQCEGGDLNNQTCQSIGFSSGTLSCRISCIFDTSSCGGSTSSRGGSRRRNSFDQTPDTNIVFTGQGQPESIFFVVSNGNYLTSTPVGNDGTFTLTFADPKKGKHDFLFYTASSEGVFGSEMFSIDIQEYATTYINHIFIPSTEKPSDSVVSPIGVNKDTSSFPQVLADISAGVFDNKNEGESLVSKKIIQDLVQDISQENKSIFHNVETSSNTAKVESLFSPYIDSAYWSEEMSNLSEWYPNVYISFMVPYWDVVYGLTDWFKEQNAPFSLYIIFN